MDVTAWRPIRNRQRKLIHRSATACQELSARPILPVEITGRISVNNPTSRKHQAGSCVAASRAQALTLPLLLSRALISILVGHGLPAGDDLCAAENRRTVSFVVDPSPGPAARHGIARFQSALQLKGWTVQPVGSPDAAAGSMVVLAGTASGRGPAAQALRDAGGAIPSASEGLAVRKTSWRGKSMLVLCGGDDRGLMYAALDTADRVGWSPDPSDPFS